MRQAHFTWHSNTNSSERSLSETTELNEKRQDEQLAKASATAAE